MHTTDYRSTTSQVLVDAALYSTGHHRFSRVPSRCRHGTQRLEAVASASDWHLGSSHRRCRCLVCDSRPRVVDMDAHHIRFATRSETAAGHIRVRRHRVHRRRCSSPAALVSALDADSPSLLASTWCAGRFDFRAPSRWSSHPAQFRDRTVSRRPNIDGAVCPAARQQDCWPRDIHRAGVAQDGESRPESDFCVMTVTPNHALQRTRPSRHGCNRGLPRAGLLSLGR
jgi:hypothetical protein